MKYTPMRSFEEDDLHARYGAWRYWHWLGRLRGLLLWTRIRWMGLWGIGGTIRLKPGLYVMPGASKNKHENLEIRP